MGIPRGEYTAMHVASGRVRRKNRPTTSSPVRSRAIRCLSITELFLKLHVTAPDRFTSALFFQPFDRNPPSDNQ